MTVAAMESQSWPRGKWWGIVALIFAAQLGLIFWLGDRDAIKVRPAASAPVIRLAGKGHADLLFLDDPTLFALPNRRGFSGLSWLTVPKLPTYFFTWSESPQWLSASPPHFRAMAGQSVETNATALPLTFSRPEPAVMTVKSLPTSGAMDHSTLRLEGGLASFKLKSPIALASQPAADLLASTEVQVVVDSAGRLMSLPVLLAKSGSVVADKEALRLAATASFEPLVIEGPKPGAGRSSDKLTWGRMIFEWRTVPLPATNAASAP